MTFFQKWFGCGPSDKTGALRRAVNDFKKRIMSTITDLQAAVNDFVAAQVENNAAVDAAIADLQAVVSNQGLDQAVQTQIAAIKATTAATRSETSKLQTALAAIFPPSAPPSGSGTPITSGGN